jgi:hypothetical protein
MTPVAFAASDDYVAKYPTADKLERTCIVSGCTRKFIILRGMDHYECPDCVRRAVGKNVEKT